MLLPEFFSRLPRLQIAGQAGGQQAEYSVRRLLIVGKQALHDVFGVHDRGGEDMEPEHVLIDAAQAGEGAHKHAHHSGKGAEVAGVPRFIIFWKGGAVPEPVVENRLVRVGDPELEVGLPQALHRLHRVGQHGEGVECQTVKNGRGLFVHISKALGQQLFLAVKIAVQGAGRDPGQLADILDAHTLQAVLAHGLHRGQENSCSGVVQSHHVPVQQPAVFRLLRETIIHCFAFFDNTDFSPGHSGPRKNKVDKTTE